MEEIEDHTERLREEVHEHAHEAREPWIALVALASAIIAALAAVTSLMAGHHANEGMIEQMRASDGWNFFQAKSIKATVLAQAADALEYQQAAAGGGVGSAAAAEAPHDPPAGAAHHPALAEAVKEKRAKVGEYKHEQDEIEREAKAAEAASRHHMHQHQFLAYGVTMFQVAIAVGAICVLTRRFGYFFVTVGFALVGAAFLAWGMFA